MLLYKIAMNQPDNINEAKNRLLFQFFKKSFVQTAQTIKTSNRILPSKKYRLSLKTTCKLEAFKLNTSLSLDVNKYPSIEFETVQVQIYFP